MFDLVVVFADQSRPGKFRQEIWKIIARGEVVVEVEVGHAEGVRPCVGYV